MDISRTLAAIEERLRQPSPDVPGLPAAQQLARLTHRLEHVITEEDLARKLATGRALRVKFGIDPTGTQIHVGHFVGYRKLRQFQRLGHTIQVLVGSFTAMIGDPSDKLAMRQPLTREQVEANMATYHEQIGRYVDLAKAQHFSNGDWFSQMKLETFLPLMATLTVSQMLERETFKLRYEKGTPIGVHEFVYPLLQGYDSVAMESDVELGGTDQLFNMLRGRDLQSTHGQEPQVVLTTPLLLGTDGRKMSKSYGNFIALTDTPDDAFGKILSVDDEAIGAYARLLTDMTDAEWAELEAAMRAGANPKDVKMLVARAVIAELHDWDVAAAAEATWVSRFSAGSTPTDLPELRLTDAQKTGTFAELLVELGFCTSKSEARRLFEQGAVKELSPDGSEEKLDAASIAFAAGTHTFKVGKKHFVKTVA